MNYSNIEKQNVNNKDKRIAFLSIFSSLNSSSFESRIDGKEGTDLAELAFIITNRLFEYYPIVEAQAPKGFEAKPTDSWRKLPPDYGQPKKEMYEATDHEGGKRVIDKDKNTTNPY